MGYIQLILSFLLGTVVSSAVIVLILRKAECVDSTQRDAEFHHRPDVKKSRLGGLALAATFVAVVVFYKLLGGWQPEPAEPYPCRKIAFVVLLMFGLGLWDDLFPLGARRKLLGQFVIASIAYFLGIAIIKFQIPFGGHIIDLSLWSWLVTVLWLVVMTNLINLIDGVDGLAGGICLMLMALLVFVGGGTGPMSFIAAGMAGALLGFLRFNFPPARIYMGDGGAYFLGFLVGCISIVSSQKGVIAAALTAPLFVLALPILDTSLAIIRRGARGLPLFRPDRSHIHHRLIESGFSRRQIVLGIYGFTAFFLALGFVTFWWQGEHLAVLLGLGFVVILAAAGWFNFSREWFAVGRTFGNSMAMRAEIQYAIAQTRWLAMEGARSNNLGSLCEDTVFIARKLGYAGVRIRLEDDERTWQIVSGNGNIPCTFHHPLPGHRHCFLELTILCPSARRQTNPSTTGACLSCIRSFRVSSELLAEGWAKAVVACKKQNQFPLRFDGREKMVVQLSSNQITTDQTVITSLK